MFASRNFRWPRALVFVTLCVAWAPMGAQGTRTTADSQQAVQAAAMRESAIRVQSPARFALDHRAELLLSPQQAAQLQRLAAAQSDSVVARRGRASAAVQAINANSNSPTGKALQSWEGLVDEAAIRAEACAQSAIQADAMIGLAKDRHALGAVLSPGQQRTMDRLFFAAMTPR